MIPVGKGRGRVIAGVCWAADVDYAVTPTGTVTLMLRRGQLRWLVGRPYVELRLPDGSRYEIRLPSPPVGTTFCAIIIKQLQPAKDSSAEAQPVLAAKATRPHRGD